MPRLATNRLTNRRKVRKSIVKGNTRKPRKQNRRVNPNRSKRRRNWFAPFGMIFILGLLVGMPKAINYLKIKKSITIKNLSVIGASALSMVDIKKISGLSKGVELSREKEKDAVDRLNQHPRLSRISIIRDMTGEVAIQIKEREPAAMIQLGKLFYLDEDGRVLDEVRKPNTTPMMIVTGKWNDKNKESIYKSALEAMQIKRTLVSSGVLENDISELHYDPSIGWTFYKVGLRAPIILGGDLSKEKVARMKTLLKYFAKKNISIQSIDLDFEQKAIVKTGDKS
ncbi:MAG: cell division protein FtsQ/DivIB [Bdellovibrionales bacterium]|nr:cell division protein FtsQ/DivIB [Bdellovibrionales bacterium]